MISKLFNILNLNERYAFSLIGKLRFVILPFFNFGLKYQEKNVKKDIENNSEKNKKSLIDIIPAVSQTDLKSVISKNEISSIIERAERIMQNKILIFSSEIDFGKKVCWNDDYLVGFSWPKGKLYSHYTQVALGVNADVKFPRELSRCHHFLILGQAYIFTKDDKYVEKYIKEVRHWLKENPYKKSINWGCSMDIAIRASNWIYSLRMVLESSLIDSIFLNEILTSLFLHGRFIYEHPEKNRVYNHNHYLSDLSGQLLIGLLFSQSNNKESKLWIENGAYEFFREIRLQILPSGFSYERSINYNRLVTELILYTVILMKNNSLEIPQDIFFRLKKMIECITQYLFSDGNAPIIGDQDSGRFLPFFQYDINYQNYLVNVGAVLFNDSYFKGNSGIGSLDILFLFGKKGNNLFQSITNQPKNICSQSFSDAGFYLMKNDNTYIFVNNSGLSHYNENVGSTHTHCDLLSFVYAYRNIPFLIDPGTYTYSGNPYDRMKFRSTYMHNTITIDGFDQNQLDVRDLWSIKRDAIPSEVNWKNDTDFVLFEGCHSGYMRLPCPAIHRRKIKLDKNNENLYISDFIEGNGSHKITAHFHFDNDVNVVRVDHEIYCEKENVRIKMSFDKKLNFDIEICDENISKAYNHLNIGKYLKIKYISRGNTEFQTLIEPN